MSLRNKNMRSDDFPSPAFFRENTIPRFVLTKGRKETSGDCRRASLFFFFFTERCSLPFPFFQLIRTQSPAWPRSRKYYIRGSIGRLLKHKLMKIAEPHLPPARLADIHTHTADLCRNACCPSGHLADREKTEDAFPRDRLINPFDDLKIEDFRDLYENLSSDTNSSYDF